MQTVSLTLRVLHKPEVAALPSIYSRLGLDYDERVLPSIGNEVLKATVAQFDASELITQRELVSARIQQELMKRAAEFNIVLEDVSLTHLSFGKEFTGAVEAKQVGTYTFCSWLDLSLYSPAGCWASQVCCWESWAREASLGYSRWSRGSRSKAYLWRHVKLRKWSCWAAQNRGCPWDCSDSQLLQEHFIPSPWTEYPLQSQWYLNNLTLMYDAKI